MTSEQKIAAETKPRRKVFKTIKWVLIVSVFIVLLLFFGIPLFLSSSGGTGFVLNKINSSVDGQVQMDDFSIGWFKGIKLTKLSYADSTGNTSVSIDSVETQPKYMSLLGGKVKLGKTVIERPQVYLRVPMIQDVVSVSEKATSSEKSDTPPPVFPVNQIDLKLINGTATVELTGDIPQTVSFTNIASTVQIADAGKPSSVDISMDVDDRSKISAKGTATPSKKGWTLEDGDFTVQISKLQVASLKPLLAIAGQKIDMSGELNADATIQIERNQIQQLKADAVISYFTQGTGDQQAVFEKPIAVSIQAGQQGETVKIDTLKIESEFCNVVCDGTLEALDYTIDADLAQTQQVVGQFVDMGDVSMAGALAAQGKVGMTDEKITFSGVGDLKKLRVQKDNVKTEATDVRLDFEGILDKAQNQLRVGHANLTATPGTVTISDLILPMSAEADKNLSLNAHATMDLAKALPFAQVFSEDLKDMEMSGAIDVAVDVSTTGSQTRILTEQSKIENLKITFPDSEPFVQDQVMLDADVLMDTEKQTLDVRTLDLKGKAGESLIRVTKGSVEKKVSTTKTQLKGDLEVDYDWQVLSAFASAYLPEGLSVKGKRKDAFRFESEYPTDTSDLMFANLDASGGVGFDSADYFGLNFGPTELNMNIRKGVLDFQIPQTVVNEGTLQFAGTIDLNEESKILRLKESMPILDRIHINDRMTNTMLKYLSPVFSGQSNISGFASLTCNKLEIPFDMDDKESIVVDGIVEMDTIRLKAIGAVGGVLAMASHRSEIEARLLPSRFLLQNGVMQYDEMEFHLDEYPTGFSGKIYLDKRLDMEVFVPYKFDVDRLRFPTVKIGEDLSDRLPLPVEGTVDKPQVRLEKMFDSILKKHSPDLIQRGIDELFKNL